MKLDIIVAVVLVVALLCAAAYFLVPAYADVRREAIAVEEIQGQVEAYDHRLADVNHQINALRTEPQAVERVAREKFGLSRDGEHIYHFSERRRNPDAAAPNSPGKTAAGDR